MRIQTKVPLAAGTFVLLAAIAFLAIRVGARASTPITLAGLRFFSASAGFALLSVVRPNWIPLKFQKADFPLMVLTGATGVVAYSVFLMIGQQSASAGMASLIVATVPIWAAVIAVTIGRERLSVVAWLGIVIAFVGTLVITVDPNRVGQLDLGAMFILAAAVSNAIYFVAVKRLVAKYGALSAVAVTVWTGSLLFLPLTLFMDPPGDWTFPVVASGLILGMGSTLAGSSLFAYLIGQLGAARASTAIYAVPPVVLALEGLIFELYPGPSLLLGGTLTLVGLFLVRPKFNRQTTMNTHHTDHAIVSGDVTVRSAKSTDIGALIELTRRLTKLNGATDPYRGTEDSVRSGLFGRHRSAEAFVALNDDEIVGYAIVARSFSTKHGAQKLIIEDLLVGPNELDAGARLALIRAIARKADEMGACLAEWTVAEDNEDALEFSGEIGAKPSREWITCTIEQGAIKSIAEGSVPRASVQRKGDLSRVRKSSQSTPCC